MSGFAQIPHLVRYQAQAVDEGGAPLEGTQTLTFRLYAAASGGTPVWEETQPGVAVTSGHFSVLLGSVAPLEVDWTQPLWLGTQLGAGSELSPRIQLTAVPLAIQAEVAKRVEGASELALAGDLSQAVAGTVAVAQGSPEVSGTGTSFTTALHVGDVVKLGSEVHRVAAIASDTALTLAAPYAETSAAALAVLRDPPVLLGVAQGDGTSVLTVTSAGKVGIGTDAPSASLSVHSPQSTVGLLVKGAPGQTADLVQVRDAMDNGLWTRQATLGSGSPLLRRSSRWTGR